MIRQSLKNRALSPVTRDPAPICPHERHAIRRNRSITGDHRESKGLWQISAGRRATSKPKRSRSIAGLVLLTVFVVAGCEQSHRKGKDVLDYGPALETLAAPVDYAAEAIKATGGLQRWAKTTKLNIDCVVTLYQPDGSFYLTEHRFEVYPWSNSIRISAREPLSNFVWQLSNGRFSLLEGRERADVSPIAGSYRDYAEAILAATTAPVRLLDNSVRFIKAPEPVKMEGLWYYPIEWVRPVEQLRAPSDERRTTSKAGTQPYWSRVIFYQNRNSSLVDMLSFAELDKQKFMAVRGYDYREVEEGGVLVPTKIEIFTTDARSIFKKRVATIDFK
jgi:predicted small secreted protein